MDSGNGHTPGEATIAIDTVDEFAELIQTHPAVLLYCSGPHCNVCRAIKPRLIEMMVQRYPKMALASIDCASSPKLAGQLRVFSIPTVVSFWNGQEGWRKSRNFSIAELRESLARPYALLFEES